MSHLKTTYRFSLFDFQRYRLNLITNNGFIDHHQKAHRNFKITFPNVIMRLSSKKMKINIRKTKYIFNILLYINKIITIFNLRNNIFFYYLLPLNFLDVSIFISSVFIFTIGLDNKSYYFICEVYDCVKSVTHLYL